MKPVIFTDLDGTLLSSKGYSFEPASRALSLIKAKEVPLVFSSSKTRAEIEALRAKTGNTHPFISENGGGVFIPKGYFPFEVDGAEKDGFIEITLGRPYEEVRRAFEEVRNSLSLDLKGFGDMTDEEVARATGLAPGEARLAKKREFDEPFIFSGGKEAEEELTRAIEKKGFTCTRGRLYHMLGRHDKGAAVRILKWHYARRFGRIVTIALGDALNDEPLLKEADYPVLVRRDDGTYENIDLPGLIKADGPGPVGWDLAVRKILAGIGTSD